MDGEQCVEDITKFTTTTPMFFVSCSLNNAPSGTEVTFSWYYHGDEKILIDEVTIETDDSGTSYNLHSNLSIPDTGWPPGDYEVVIKIHTDNAETIVKPFSVQ